MKCFDDFDCMMTPGDCDNAGLCLVGASCPAQTSAVTPTAEALPRSGGMGPVVTPEDTARLDWLQSWTEGDVALMAPGQHGGPRDAWLVALDSDKRPSGTRGYRWSCEANGKNLREAIDNCREKLAGSGRSTTGDRE